jgi:hypothetical protein
MRNRILLAAVFLVLLLPQPAFAQEPWSGAVLQAEVDFGASITFIVRAKAPQPVAPVELLFQLEGERARNRVIVRAVSGANVDAEWTWELDSGEIPPGRMITYWWRAKTQDGRTLETEKSQVEYADTRFTWERREEGNIRLFWYGGSRADADKMMQAAQEALGRLEAGTGVGVDTPVRVFLYRSKSDMSAAISSRSESYDAATITLGMAMGGDTIVILSTDAGAEDTIAHELSHIVIGKFTDNPLGGLPTWLDEGLAMYAEGDLRGDNKRDLEQAIRDNELISVRSLSGYPGQAGLVDLFYGECHSVVKFLIDTYGSGKMDRLLQTFRRGVYQEDALREVYGFGLDGLEDEWRAAIGAAPRPTPAPTSQAGDGTPQAGEPTRSPTRTPTPEKPNVEIPFCSSEGLILVMVGVLVWRRTAA